MTLGSQHRHIATVLACCAVIVCQLWHPSVAKADELEDFEHAKEAYDRGHYEQAIERFDALVGGSQPRLRSKPLVIESRKYLAAAYLFVGKRDQATKQFERLLEEDPTYQLDPVAFPREVHALFASVRAHMQQERQKQEAEQHEQTQQQLAQRRKLEEQKKRIADLERMARNEVVRHEHSRWIALIPFGVGQFQNGDRSLGIGLATTEGLMAATSLTTFFLHQNALNTPLSLLGGCAPDKQALCTKLQRRERTYRYLNWASTGLLAGLVVYGIVDAQLRFVPFTETTRKRPLPKDLQLGLGPGSLQLRVSF